MNRAGALPRFRPEPDRAAVRFSHVLGRLLGALLLSLLPLCAEAAQGTVIEGRELVFNVRTNDGEELQAWTRFLLKERNGTVYWHYRHIRGQVIWDVTTDRNSRPILVRYSEGRSSVAMRFRPDGTMHVQGVWDGRPVERQVTFQGRVTVECCMPARMVSRDGLKRYSFKLLRTEKLPELKTYKMLLQNVGKEEIRVPAGTFECTKMKLIPANPLLRAFYRGYLYISRDDCRYIVRMDNVPKGFSYTLESIRDVQVQQERAGCNPDQASGQ